VRQRWRANFAGRALCPAIHIACPPRLSCPRESRDDEGAIMPASNSMRASTRSRGIFSLLWQDMNRSKIEWEILHRGARKAVPLQELSRSGKLTRKGRLALAALHRLIEEGRKQDASEVASKNGQLAEGVLRQLARDADQRPLHHGELRAAIRRICFRPGQGVSGMANLSVPQDQTPR